MNNDIHYTADFYRGDRRVDQWSCWGDPSAALATHNRMFPVIAADRVVISKVEAA